MKLFVFGYFGRHNLGDEAILHSFLNWTRGRFPGSEFKVLTADPEWTAERYGVGAVPKMSLKGIAGAVRWCDGVVAPGGGIFQDSTSSRSVIYYLFLLILARLCGKPVFMVSQGVGPLARKWVRKLVGWGLAKCVTRLWVRDEQALDFVHGMGLDGLKYGLGADMVFGLLRSNKPGAPRESEATLRVGVSLRPSDGLEHAAGLIERSLLRLHKERPVELRLFVFDREEDVAPINRFAEEMRRSAPGLDVRILGASKTKPAGVDEMFEAVAETDVMVGMRLHSLVFSALSGVPFVGICYDPKVKAFSEACGQPFIQDPKAASAVEIESAVVRLVGESGEETRKTLTDAVGKLAKLLDESLEAFAYELNGVEDGRMEVLGIPVSGLSLDRTVEKIKESVRNGEKLHIVTVNPEMLMRALGDVEFGKLLKSGTMNTPDGVGVRIAVRLKYGRRIGAVTGVDMAELLLGDSRAADIRIFMLGGKPEVIEKCAAKLGARPDRPLLVGLHHGYLKDIDDKQLTAEINETKPDILLAGMGSPLQEYWIRDHIDRLDAKVFIGVGGTFDVLAGEAKRAPAIFRKTGLEWAYRVISDPSRLKRISGFPKFVWLVLKESLKRRKT